LKKNHSQSKRPLTSSIDRERINFRVSELSRAKKILRGKSKASEDMGKKTSLRQIKREQNGSRQNISGSRVSLIRG
jgi:hypothetical protein